MVSAESDQRDVHGGNKTLFNSVENRRRRLVRARKSRLLALAKYADADTVHKYRN
jgi:hypothetical protein